MTAFNDLQLLQPILKALQEEQYHQPTPIQQKTIPEILKGHDILACAQTGIGKTAAFAIPILQAIHNRQTSSKLPQALVLCPTRELAIQVEESFITYGRYLSVRCLALYGGVSQVNQEKELKRKVDVIVATPGRLLDFIQQELLDLSGIHHLVLDEADRMLDMGFIHDVKRILRFIPEKRQTLFFSATMQGEVQKLAQSILNNPVQVKVNPVSSTATKIQQSVYYVEQKEKTALLLSLIKTKGLERTLVFTRTKYGADRLCKQLKKQGIQSAAIHGDKSQGARQKALTDFKKSQLQILVATDIAARGIDIDDLGFVVNYEIPNIPETYVHRIGRTGRAGQEGMAISFCNPEEKTHLKNIQKLIGDAVPEATLNN